MPKNSFSSQPSRREFTAYAAALVAIRELSHRCGAADLGQADPLQADLANSNQSTPQYRIGVCDWMILKRQKLGALPLASQVSISMTWSEKGEVERFFTLKDQEPA